MHKAPSHSLPQGQTALKGPTAHFVHCLTHRYTHAGTYVHTFTHLRTKHLCTLTVKNYIQVNPFATKRFLHRKKREPKQNSSKKFEPQNPTFLNHTL